MHRKPIVERAFELAQTGDYVGLNDLRRALRAEGYSAQSQGEISGMSVKRQLKQVCDSARAERRCGP